LSKAQVQTLEIEVF